jgi:hypothetical protein
MAFLVCLNLSPGLAISYPLLTPTQLLGTGQVPPVDFSIGPQRLHLLSLSDSSLTQAWPVTLSLCLCWAGHGYPWVLDIIHRSYGSLVSQSQCRTPVPAVWVYPSIVSTAILFCCDVETGSCYVASTGWSWIYQATGLKFAFFPPQLPKLWGYTPNSSSLLIASGMFSGMGGGWKRWFSREKKQGCPHCLMTDDSANPPSTHPLSQLSLLR